MIITATPFTVTAQIGSSGISPDGSSLFFPSTDVLTNKQGTWSVGDVYAEDDGAGHAVFRIKLNGRYVAEIQNVPGAGLDFGVVAVSSLWVDNGGWVYAFVSGDNGYAMYVNAGWVASGDTSGRAAPAAGYMLSHFAPPYTSSPDGTRITAPATNTVTNQDGVWGITNGVLTLNGVGIVDNRGGNNDSYPPNAFQALAIEINSHGTAFVQASDSTWRSFAGLAANPSAGPTASPVPVSMTITPLNGQLIPTAPPGSPRGTKVATLTVTMSDGSVVTPTTAEVALVADQGYPGGLAFEYVSPNIQSNGVPLTPGYDTFLVQVTINGTSFCLGTLVGTS
jgi:hypothetical protein